MIIIFSGIGNVLSCLILLHLCIGPSAWNMQYPVFSDLSSHRIRPQISPPWEVENVLTIPLRRLIVPGPPQCNDVPTRPPPVVDEEGFTLISASPRKTVVNWNPVKQLIGSSYFRGTERASRRLVTATAWLRGKLQMAAFRPPYRKVYHCHKH